MKFQTCFRIREGCLQLTCGRFNGTFPGIKQLHTFDDEVRSMGFEAQSVSRISYNRGFVFRRLRRKITSSPFENFA